MHILHMEAGSFGHDNGMRTAHVFFYAFIEDMAAVNGPGAANGSLGHAVADDESLHPLPIVDTVGIGGSVAAVIAGKVIVRDVGLIGVRVINSLQHSAFLQIQFHMIPKVNRAAQEGAGRDNHPSAAFRGTGVDSRLDGRSTSFTGHGTIVTDGNGLGCGGAGLDQDQ